MSFALLFAGQGTQHAAMLPWLDDAQPLVQRTTQALGVADWRDALRDTAWAGRNHTAQLLLTGLGLAAWAQLARHLPAPAAVAGYSVGELAAFSVAGVCEPTMAIDLARVRAELMDQAAVRSPGGLLSLNGPDESTLAHWCGAHGCAVAIRLAPDAVIAGGPPPAVKALQQHAESQGAKCSSLNVAVPSHTPGMQSAATSFARALKPLSLKTPALALLCNARGDLVHSAAQAADDLAAQIAQTVQWSACLEAMHARQPRCVLEIGPGTALSAMWNRRFTDIPARSVDEFRAEAAVVRWVSDRLDRAGHR